MSGRFKVVRVPPSDWSRHRPARLNATTRVRKISQQQYWAGKFIAVKSASIVWSARVVGTDHADWPGGSLGLCRNVLMVSWVKSHESDLSSSVVRHVPKYCTWCNVAINNKQTK